MLRNRRCRGQKFRREYPIPPSTVDFCCVAWKLIIEVDSEHHPTDEGRQHDQRRDRFLSEKGYEVERVPGFQVLRDPTAVQRLIELAIDQCLQQRRPSSPAWSGALL